ncbi:conserved protein of unknown function (plasmid) [Rhodovastum atsumiense]|uniref:Uncharacterized protein n=1 Tax=Rhodovastum atsumiense TaxID=504468 RepID=A0A5M6IU34_9PROT|nr:hypothetical protein [Rhodovastum atsumiense]KAA5611833.1 hypothetical protein F1189_12410 [Rhodovastum atsumiense]CAH2606054.1 conserved protein of unknown function [Rhodovastum atsumiense]
MTGEPSLLARLAIVGEALHGAEWQRAIARDLGPLHPAGPRPQIDDRLVRRWLAGERPVPAWIGDALPALLERAVRERQQHMASLERLRANLARATAGGS